MYNLCHPGEGTPVPSPYTAHHVLYFPWYFPILSCPVACKPCGPGAHLGGREGDVLLDPQLCGASATAPRSSGRASSRTVNEPARDAALDLSAPVDALAAAAMLPCHVQSLLSLLLPEAAMFPAGAPAAVSGPYGAAATVLAANPGPDPLSGEAASLPCRACMDPSRVIMGCTESCPSSSAAIWPASGFSTMFGGPSPSLLFRAACQAGAPSEDISSNGAAGWERVTGVRELTREV